MQLHGTLWREDLVTSSTADSLVDTWRTRLLSNSSCFTIWLLTRSSHYNAGYCQLGLRYGGNLRRLSF